MVKSVIKGYKRKKKEKKNITYEKIKFTVELSLAYCFFPGVHKGCGTEKAKELSETVK